MQVGLVGFLKHVLSLIKCFRLYISQKKTETVALVGSTLRSPINIKLSYLDNNRSKLLPILLKRSDIKDLLGLYEQQKTHVVFLKLNSAKSPSIVILVNTEVFHHRYHLFQIYKVQKTHECETV